VSSCAETGIGTAKRDTINAFLIGANKSFFLQNPLRALLKGKEFDFAIQFVNYR